MLLRSPLMSRKVLALVIVLIVSSLAPATAMLGSCATMPCCAGTAGQSTAVNVERPDCCATITCYEAPSPELSLSAKEKPFTATTLATLTVTLATRQVAVARGTSDDPSPPPKISKRLSSLSTFLL
jgi:hypothetical protein